MDITVRWSPFLTNFQYDGSRLKQAALCCIVLAVSSTHMEAFQNIVDSLTNLFGRYDMAWIPPLIECARIMISWSEDEEILLQAVPCGFLPWRRSQQCCHLLGQGRCTSVRSGLILCGQSFDQKHSRRASKSILKLALIQGEQAGTNGD